MGLTLLTTIQQHSIFKAMSISLIIFLVASHVTVLFLHSCNPASSICPWCVVLYDIHVWGVCMQVYIIKWRQTYCQTSSINRIKLKTKMFLVSSCSGLCQVKPIIESNYNWMINNLIAYYGATYIKRLTVYVQLVASEGGRWYSSCQTLLDRQGR